MKFPFHTYEMFDVTCHIFEITTNIALYEFDI